VRLKSRLMVLLVTTQLAIALAISALHLNGLVATWLESVRDRSDLTAQFVKTLVLQRINELTEQSKPATVEEATRLWKDYVRTDPQITSLLERTMAQSKTIVEISIAGRNGIILASSNPSSIDKPMVSHPTVAALQTMNQLDRFLETIESHRDYETRLPLAEETTQPGKRSPLFNIQVLASSVLQRDALLPHIERVAAVSAGAVIIAIFMSLLAASLALRPLEKISQRLDQIATGAVPPPSQPPGTTTKEFAVVQSKLDFLGEQFRSAQKLVENLQDAILVVDADERIVLAGEPSQRLLGIARIDLVGHTLAEALPLHTELGGVLHKTMHLQLPLADREVIWPRKGQASVRLLVSLELLPGTNDRGGALITMRDAEGRQQVQSQLDLSERLGAIGRLTGGVAHEIKNPLNSIALRLEVLRAKVSHESPEANEQIDIIADEVTRLDRVVKTFLDFTRPISMTLSDVDLRTLLEEIAHLVEPAATAANVTINMVSEPGYGFNMRGDRDLLKQALLNVVMNGIESMPEGGAMRIKIESLLSSRQGRQAVIGISDAGPGIPLEQRDKIFQLYFTTKSQGSGIGLAIAFRVAQLHGGKIEFSSNLGQGTTFIFLLPLSEKVRE
jgi:signal transduction histidine kinase